MTEPIRILQVFASLDRGGAEAMIMNLYKNINRAKIQFDFVVNDRNEIYAHEEEIRKLGGRIFRIPRLNFGNYLKYRKAWHVLLSNHSEFKAVHAHHTSPAFIYLSIAKKYGVTTIAHSHTAGDDKSIKAFIKKNMRNLIIYRADYLIACSLNAAKWMFGRYFKKALILTNAVDSTALTYDELQRIQKRKEFNYGNDLVIGHIGRFQNEKNHLFLIEIFNSIVDAMPNSKLILVGTGQLFQEVREKVYSLGLQDKVAFTGSRSDIPDLLNAMDVFLFPSLFEGLPVTLIEAQANGLKCIVSDTITKEVDITGLVEFIPLSKPASYWAEQVLKYADGYERKDTYAAICAAGYDIKDNAKWLENFYLNLHSEANRSK